MSDLKNLKSSYRVSLKGLVRDEQGKILFVKERDNWDLPGGGLEHGEDPIQGLKREFDEELGVKIEINESSCKVISTWNQKFDEPVCLVIYRVQLLSQPVITSEVSDFGYFSMAEIENYSRNLDSTLAGILDQIYD